MRSNESAPVLLVSVNPDLISGAGHYLYMDRELAREAGKRGWDFQAWGNQALPNRVLNGEQWLRPIFPDVGTMTAHHPTDQRERFFQALLNGCQSVLESSETGKVTLFFYAGHPCQIVAFWRLLQRIPDPRLRVVFNLYAAHWEFDETRPRYRYMADTLKRVLAPGAMLADRRRFVLTSDSGTVAQLAEKWWRSEVPVLPFFSIANASTGGANGEERKRITVSYPSSVHRHRGFGAFPEMVRSFQATGGEAQFVFRTCLEESMLSGDERDLCNQLRELGCEVRQGTLSDEEMALFFRKADIILSPYPVAHFKDRTSANVADALAFGKPVVAARNTWAGRLIEQLGCGATFPDGDGAGMADAVRQVIRELPRFTEQARSQGEIWRQSNNLSVLVDVVDRLATAPPAELTRDVETDWMGDVLALLDSPANESLHAVVPSQVVEMPEARPTPVVPSPRVEQLKYRITQLQEQGVGMRRAIEHYRASPVRALRLWLNRKLRRLTLEE